MSLIPATGAPGGADSDAGADRQYLSFRLAGHVYGVPLAQVAEITPNRELNVIPHMPRGVEGLLDLRGQVIPVINLRVRLGLERQDADQSRNIVVLDMGAASNVGLLVDNVESVVQTAVEELVAASPLLAGPEGAYVQGFVLTDKGIIGLLDPRQITTIHGARAHGLSFHAGHDVEQALDDSLQQLIASAPPRTEHEAARIIPQMEQAIAHTEREMEKVLERVEGMLTGTDRAFQALVRLKQEAGLGHMKGLEKDLAELEGLGSRLQDEVFGLIQRLQYQDIARQKLERVLNHIRGLQVVVGSKFRDAGKLA